MQMNCDTAHKLVRWLQVDHDALLQQETEVSTYSFLAGESVETPVYDFSGTQKKLREYENKITKIKHAVNMFNAETVLEKTGLTIDAALVRMAMLTQQRNKLNEMRSKQLKTRHTTIRGVSEYTVRNYDSNEAEAAYRAVSEELMLLQQELNTANLTKTFEVDI